MHHIKTKPALAGTGSAELSDRGDAFDTSRYNENRRLNQASQRLVAYVLTADLVAMEAVYG